jgi:hypothetical protein
MGSHNSATFIAGLRSMAEHALNKLKKVIQAATRVEGESVQF